MGRDIGKKSEEEEDGRKGRGVKGFFLEFELLPIELLRVLEKKSPSLGTLRIVVTKK